MATLEDLEARVAALEASQADYRAVLAAINALAANQREHALGLAAVKNHLAAVKALVPLQVDIELGLAEVKTYLAEDRPTWPQSRQTWPHFVRRHGPHSDRSTSSSPKSRT